MTGQFDQHLPWIKGELAASPAASLAISIDEISYTATSHEIGIDLIQEFVKEADLESLEGQLHDDARRFRDATDILNHRTPILGMSYLNFVLNVRDCGWELTNFASSDIARDLVARITAAEPRLERIIRDRPALVPF